MSGHCHEGKAVSEYFHKIIMDFKAGLLLVSIRQRHARRELILIIAGRGSSAILLYTLFGVDGA